MNILTKLKEAGKWILVFTIIRILFAIIEQVLLYVFYPYAYWFDATFLLSCLSFLVITLLTAKWIDRKRYYLIFPIILFLFLNSVLFFCLKTFETHNFYINAPGFAEDCWIYSNNIISDILMYIKPFYCLHDGGVLTNFNPVYFYILYTITPFLYYLGLTYLCNYIVKKKIKKHKLTNQQ